MKKLWIALLILIMMATVIGCSGEEAGESKTPKQAIKTELGSVGQDFTIGEKLIVINSVEKFLQYNEEEAYEEGQEPQAQEGLAINIEWTNKSEESMSFSNYIYITVFQDGIELDQIYRNDEDYNEAKNIRPGITLDIKKAYLPRSTSPLEIEIIEYDIDSDKIASFIIEAEFPE